MKIWSRGHSDCAQVICEQAAALPDYYPPILRVVRTAGRPWVKEVREQAGVVQVSGEVALTLLYQTEDEKGLCAYHTSAPFSHSFSLPEGCSGQVDAYAGMADVTCRLTSARRVAFKVTVPIYLTVDAERELCGPAPCEGMHYLVKSVQGRCMLGCVTRRFHLSEKGECDRLPAAVLDTQVSAVVTELAGAGGKTLVKGELAVRTLYVTKDDEVGVACYTFPVSQLLDLPFGENIDCEIRMRVCAVEVETGETAEGGRGWLHYEIDLSVMACAAEHRSCDLICDAFSATHAPILTRDTANVVTGLGRTRGSVEVHLPLPEDPEGGVVLDVVAQVPPVSAKASEGKVILEGECALAVLMLEDSGRIRSRELTLPLTATLPHHSQGRITAQVCLWSALPMGDGVRLTLRYELAMWQDTTCEYLSAAAPDSATPLPALERQPVTVYFADKGETIWDIAKKYRISPDRIRKDNGIEGEKITENCRLLIL